MIQAEGFSPLGPQWPRIGAAEVILIGYLDPQEEAGLRRLSTDTVAWSVQSFCF